MAASIVAVANGTGLRASALITDMDQVPGTHVSNGLKVAETVAILTDGRDARLEEVVIALAAEMLHLGEIVPDLEAGQEKAESVFENGQAAEKFAKMITAFGDTADFVEKSEHYLDPAR